MKSLNDLKIRKKLELSKYHYKNNKEIIRIVVGMATCGISAGAKVIFEVLKNEIISNDKKNVVVKKTGCIGICKYEPLIEIYKPGREKVTFVNLDVYKAREIFYKYVIEDNLDYVKDYIFKDTKFFYKQKRIALRNCGIIDPEDIGEFIAFDGYKALNKTLTQMTSKEVINTIIESGLRGRGGGGFPTGLKWQYAYKSRAIEKFVICNADEGDPGAFMDRAVLEGDPHSVIEAMAIAGYAIGANQGYIYIRAEYPVAVLRLEEAIRQAKELRLLGENIFGTGFNFDLEIRLGAGAFVCGEETALLNSIEGQRGMPRPRPPFPANKGLWNKPTMLNNVETYANIAPIILKGSTWFSSIGTDKSKGTKVFALGGKINITGLVEIPMGTTLREIIYEIGDGIPNGKEFKAVQTGGPSGGCITKEYLDTEIDYDNLVALGSMMGSGGMIVMDEENCMVDIARFFLDFIVDESCGKCIPCREGTKRMLEIVEKITKGKGTMEDLQNLQSLAHTVKRTSLCGLGQTAPNPVLSTLKYFRDEYEKHIINKKCPAGVCEELLSYQITDSCLGCTKCTSICPTNSIKGEKKQVHIINQNKCIKCAKCYEICPVNAIVKK